MFKPKLPTAASPRFESALCGGTKIVTLPSFTLTPAAKPGFSAVAFATPLVASCSA